MNGSLCPIFDDWERILFVDLIGKGVVGVNFCHLLFKKSALLRVGGFDVIYRCGDTRGAIPFGTRWPTTTYSRRIGMVAGTPGQASEKLLKNGLCNRQLFLLKLDLINKNAF